MKNEAYMYTYTYFKNITCLSGGAIINPYTAGPIIFVFFHIL